MKKSSIGIFPNYEDLFPGQDVPTIEKITSEVSSITLLKAISFLSMNVHMSSTNMRNQEEIFDKWISAFDIDTYKFLRNNYLTFRNKVVVNGHQPVLFASVSLLYIQNYIINHFNNLPHIESGNVNSEMALLKAWLVSNSTYDSQIVDKAQGDSNDLSDILLQSQSSQYEHTDKKEFIYQIIMSDAFFKFLKENSKTSFYFYNFLKLKSIDNYNQYLLNIINVYSAYFSKNKSFAFEIGNENKDAIIFFDSMSIDIKELLTGVNTNTEDNDYILLRNKPLIKESEHLYYPLNLNFFVDKLYQGLIFDFYNQSGISNNFKTFSSFLQYLGQAFAEQYLFYPNVSKCFIKRKHVVQAFGDQYMNQEYSDFYLRDGQNLFLFEFKNVMINSSTKLSGKSFLIKSEILKKLSYDPIGKKDKGIKQLYNVIKELNNESFSFDDLKLKKIKKLNIYPVIVYTDYFFSLGGIQSLISEEFQKAIEPNIMPKFKVNDVTLMHIQDIIDIQSLVQTRNISFRRIIETYYAKRKVLMKKRSVDPTDLLSKYYGFRKVMQDIFPFDDHRDTLLSALGLQEDI